MRPFDHLLWLWTAPGAELPRDVLQRSCTRVFGKEHARELGPSLRELLSAGLIERARKGWRLTPEGIRTRDSTPRPVMPKTAPERPRRSPPPPRATAAHVRQPDDEGQVPKLV